MSDEPLRAAIKATAQAIADDDALAVAAGCESIPIEEVILDPSPHDYVAPPYLKNTAPHLAPAFATLLSMLRKLNARFVGEPTLEVQATLSLTGEHEFLEEKFFGWCQLYFKIRGSHDRLNPRNDNDPLRLVDDCLEEFNQLLEWRIAQCGTINSSILNMSQRFMRSAFAAWVLGPDPLIASTREWNPTDRMCDTLLRAATYSCQIEEFYTFLQQLAQHLPAEYVVNDDPTWFTDIQSKVATRAEDLAYLRQFLCVLRVHDSEKQRLADGHWARFDWDVYHGSVAAVLTSSSQEVSSERTTMHQLAFRRDGWLCHREYPWLRVQPDYLPEQRATELAVSWYILDTLTSHFYEAWGRLDRAKVISGGQKADATEEEQTAALAMAVIDTDEVETETAIATRPKLRKLRLTRIQAILERIFACEWSMGKGSEQKVFKPGGKHFTFGCHGVDRTVEPVQLKNCLKNLGIPVPDFIAACDS